MSVFVHYSNRLIQFAWTTAGPLASVVFSSAEATQFPTAAEAMDRCRAQWNDQELGNVTLADIQPQEKAA